MEERFFNQTVFFTNIKSYNRTVTEQRKLQLPETIIMSLTIGLGFLVVVVAVAVLLRSCSLKQKRIYVTLSSLILIGTICGVCTVCCWRMFAASVGNLPTVNLDVFTQCLPSNYSSSLLCEDFVKNLT